MRRFLPLAFFILAGLFLNPTAAIAHAGVISSNPTEGQVLTEMPKEISVTFSEELLLLPEKQVNTLLLNPYDGPPINLINIRVEENNLIASLPRAQYSPGRYEMAYRVISADGHEVSGIVSFSFKTSTEGVEKADLRDEGSGKGEEGALNISPPVILAFLAALLLAAFLLFTRRRSSK